MSESAKVHVWETPISGDTIRFEFVVRPDGSLGESTIDPEKLPHLRLYGWTGNQLVDLAGAYRHGYGVGRNAAHPFRDDWNDPAMDAYDNR